MPFSLTGPVARGSTATAPTRRTAVAAGGPQRPTRDPDVAAGIYKPPPYTNPGLVGQISNIGLQQGLLGAGLGMSNEMTDLQKEEARLRNAAAQGQLGINNNYLNQQKGFANTDADLARQMLGSQRGDYSRDWKYRQWQMQNDLAARGAMVTPGSRFQHSDMAQQLLYADQQFGIKGKQIDANLAAELARIDHDLAQNGLDASSRNKILQNHLAQLGIQGNSDQMRALMDSLSLSAEQAQLGSQLALEKANYYSNYYGWGGPSIGDENAGPAGKIPAPMPGGSRWFDDPSSGKLFWWDGKKWTEQPRVAA